MLSKENFISQMKELQKLDEELNSFCDMTEKFFEGSVFDLGYKLIDKSVNLLCRLMDDEDSKIHDSWIYWFIYENDWGKGEFSAGYDNKTKKIKTIEQLYTLLNEQNKRIKDKEILPKVNTKNIKKGYEGL